MKLNEVADVIQHPAMKRADAFSRLQNATLDNADEVIDFIMDDKNAVERRLQMMKKLDELLGVPSETYTLEDLEEFMNDPDLQDSIDR